MMNSAALLLAAAVFALASSAGAAAVDTVETADGVDTADAADGVETADAVETDVSGCVDAAVAAIQRRYESVRDLRANFVQTARPVALAGSAVDAAQESRGKVVFAKPGKMRWSYESPEPSLVVSDGRTLWIYDPANAEVQRTRVAEGFMSGAAVQFLVGEGDMRRDFDVVGIHCGPDAVELELTPKRDATYEKLRVVVAHATGEMRRTTVYDLLGNVTEVAFDAVEVNVAPDDAVFRFEVPEGVELIDLDVR